ncbi:MAG: glycosyltransferase family 1 protein [Patescibacteria group bacterium]|nr:MAG: glycosyltransferase family 1 protein [Patescibacteria group bacterium]
MALIGIDASRANAHERTGTEWYSFELIQALKKIQVPGLEFLLYSKKFLRDGLEQFPPGWDGKILYWRTQRFWNQFRLSWELMRHPVDLLFQPTHTLPLYTPKRVVTTLHDIGFERMPKLYRPAELRYHQYSAQLAVRRANRILTVSEFSRREIIERYKLPADRVVTTPLAVDTNRYRPDISDEEKDAVLSKYRLSRPFFIYTGRVEEKKNIVNLIHAFSIFKSARGVGDPVKLLLVGLPGFGIERVKKEIVARKLEGSVLLPGYVPEADMPALVAAARLLLLPSWYEGFGLPILQGQACGTPVIAARTASMPEVGGDAALYAHPDEPEDFARVMKSLMDEASEWDRRRALGFENAKRFSWDETARRTMNVLLEVLGIQHQL